MHLIRFRLGIPQTPLGGAHSTPSHSLDGFKGPCFKVKGRRECREGREGRESDRKGGRRGERERCRYFSGGISQPCSPTQPSIPLWLINV